VLISMTLTRGRTFAIASRTGVNGSYASSFARHDKMTSVLDASSRRFRDDGSVSTNALRFGVKSRFVNG